MVRRNFYIRAWWGRTEAPTVNLGAAGGILASLLLNNMGEFVREQRPAIGCVRLEFTISKHDVAPKRESSRVERARKVSGVLSTVQPNVFKASAKARLKEVPQARGQRFPAALDRLWICDAASRGLGEIAGVNRPRRRHARSGSPHHSPRGLPGIPLDRRFGFNGNRGSNQPAERAVAHLLLEFL
jgi:hypothetical protein